MRTAAAVMWVALAAACGGLTDDSTGAAGTGGAGGKGLDAGVDGATDASMPKDATADYHDPGCPDSGPPTMDFACDPTGPVSGCGLAEACEPFAKYPKEGCSQEAYGARCVASGTSAQGESCDYGCLPHFTCVVSGQGTQCIRLCDLTAASGCPGGLVCEPIDVPGVGGCI
jgi:hypothetical protein